MSAETADEFGASGQSWHQDSNDSMEIVSNFGLAAASDEQHCLDAEQAEKLDRPADSNNPTTVQRSDHGDGYSHDGENDEANTTDSYMSDISGPDEQRLSTIGRSRLDGSTSAHCQPLAMLRARELEQHGSDRDNRPQAPPRLDDPTVLHDIDNWTSTFHNLSEPEQPASQIVSDPQLAGESSPFFSPAPAAVAVQQQPQPARAVGQTRPDQAEQPEPPPLSDAQQERELFNFSQPVRAPAAFQQAAAAAATATHRSLGPGRDALFTAADQQQVYLRVERDLEDLALLCSLQAHSARRAAAQLPPAQPVLQSSNFSQCLHAPVQQPHSALDLALDELEQAPQLLDVQLLGAPSGLSDETLQPFNEAERALLRESCGEAAAGDDHRTDAVPHQGSSEEELQRLPDLFEQLFDDNQSGIVNCIDEAMMGSDTGVGSYCEATRTPRFLP